MANGLAVYDATGTLIWDTDGILARIVSSSIITFDQTSLPTDVQTRTVTVPSVYATDVILIVDTDNVSIVYSMTTSGTTITLTRTRALNGAPSSHNVIVLRRS